VNIIERYIPENFSPEEWRAACASSRKANKVCAFMLAAAGLVEVMEDGVVIDISTDDEYAAAYFAAAEKLDEAA
jgi:hypothetical protein